MRSRLEPGRIEAFSDAVFAIAITLLALDIAIPQSDLHDPWAAIGRQWPAYLGYVTSFLTIGGIWLAHHRIFRCLQYVSGAVVRVNLLLLMAVAFLPFPTRFVSESIHSKYAERAAVVFYGITLFVVSALIGALWAALRRDRELLKPDVSSQEVNAIARTTAPMTLLYVGATLLGIFIPRAAAFGYLLIAAGGVIRSRRDTEFETQPASAPNPRVDQLTPP